MGVIDLFCNTSTICIDMPNLTRSCCSFRQSKIRVMSFSVLPDSVKVDDSQQDCGFSLTGDSFIRPHLHKLSSYQPILPFEVLSICLGRKPEDIVKLDVNENPYGPPPEVFEALGSMRFPYVYPDPESR
ncbi:histidinol-phosphate aminotransferase, chloroplastic-like [Primulina tabacum]|uniref:histidinol-phosphate aminotransferase, chloroplastic-like n=1 Tax=Primulina tabacum TaxID=48773 RepID=UPI003F5ABBAE